MRTNDGLDADVERLADLLAELGRRNTLRDPLAQSVEALDFSPPQVHALLWLGTDGALPMSVLAQRVSVTEKAATGMVDRLEEAGLVRRERDPADRRIVRVALTGSGAAAAKQLHQGVRLKMKTLLGLLSAADRHSLLRIIATLTERMGEVAAPPARTGEDR